MSHRTAQVRHWWRVIVTDVMGPMFIDNARSREEAVDIAEREDRGHVGWPASRVIEFTERGREREMEYIR
jgi:hypothetical protein